MGNPFIEDIYHLFTLDTKDIMSEDVINTVWTIMQLGQEQYNKFIEERFLRADHSTEQIFAVLKALTALSKEQKCWGTEITEQRHGTVC